MAWIIQSMMEGPLILSDLGGITLTKGQTRDLDIIGRGNAERSNDVKIALVKNWIKEIRKDAAPSESSGAVDPAVMQEVKDAAEESRRASEAHQEALGRLEERNKGLEDEVKRLREQTKRSEHVIDKAESVLASLEEFARSDPLGIRHIKEVLENIGTERKAIAEERAMLGESHSDEEIRTHDMILALRDKKLKKNYEQLGKSVSKDVDEVEDVDDLLNQMDDIGI